MKYKNTMALSTKSLATRSNFVVYCALILIFKTIMNINSNTQVLSNAEMKCIVGGFDGNRKTECESGATVSQSNNPTAQKGSGVSISHNVRRIPRLNQS